MWRKLLRSAGCLGYLALLGVIFALVSYISFSLFVRRGVTPTPELFGLEEEEARALATDKGLRLEWSEIDDRYDEEVPEAHVLSQRPNAGTLVKRGSAVTISLSLGPQRIEVPAIVGTALQTAQVTLAASGLVIGRTASIYSESTPSGLIVAQHPPAGARLQHGGEVNLFLSLQNASETYLMPDLVYRRYDDVKRFFTARGFRFGRVSYETYAGIEPGTVLRQFPQAGYPLRREDVISLGVVAPDPEMEQGETTEP